MLDSGHEARQGKGRPKAYTLRIGRIILISDVGFRSSLV